MHEEASRPPRNVLERGTKERTEGPTSGFSPMKRRCGGRRASKTKHTGVKAEAAAAKEKISEGMISGKKGKDKVNLRKEQE